ncbi:phosphoribosylglycinamide formyltransferase [Patellaria atrata CBS 101060]|uniref:Phosphoribosylglycinamide formyltransferase n=1 Tax=Patellaria atrata CBS 101060 TaxID=1346257 RepID=A0A9P4S5I6_9PEZI|nr:phosphoribosylglycinamide formyltransferase [Patellaria atrata CBS 101060]
MPPARITVLISGSGTNLQALIDATKDGSLPNCEIIRVISNRKSAYGLTRARNANIPTTYHNLLPYKRKEGVSESAARDAYDADLATIVLADHPDLVVCAGWMHILTPSFLDPLSTTTPPLPVINLHPALPAAFNGANAIERAHAAWVQGKVDKTGVMVHYVVQEVDMGEPIVVREIQFQEGDAGEGGVERLEERVHHVEWGVIVEGVRRAVGKLRGEGEGGEGMNSSSFVPCLDLLTLNNSLSDIQMSIWVQGSQLNNIPSASVCSPLDSWCKELDLMSPVFPLDPQGKSKGSGD